MNKSNNMTVCRRAAVIKPAHKPKSCLDRYKQEIVGLLEKGIQKKKIAQLFDVSKQTLFHFLQTNQISISLDSRLSAYENEIVNMFAQGLTMQEMADQLNTSQSAISKQIKKLKLKRTRSDTYNKQTTSEKYGAQIKQMFANNFTQQAIADALGVHVQTIKNCIKQLGLKRQKIRVGMAR